ncbi:sigma-70 family RNA polymerase sigma factor [Candidatus Fermentibacteria bacterium]|nr:sigma-70 family RNA polymerase sigma factor [Candidatus Fermentibacteria bacterium]
MDGLVAKAKCGDRAAFGVLVRECQPMVLRTVFRLVRHEDDAMDLTQDAFVRAYERLDSFQGTSSFGTWVCRIAINLALNHLRAQRPQADVDVARVAAPAPLSSESRERTVMERLDRAIAGLPPRQRLTVLLRVRDGKTHEEIASLLGCAVGTSKAAFHGAVANLRKALADLVPLMEEDDEAHLP